MVRAPNCKSAYRSSISTQISFFLTLLAWLQTDRHFSYYSKNYIITYYIIFVLFYNKIFYALLHYFTLFFSWNFIVLYFYYFIFCYVTSYWNSKTYICRSLRIIKTLKLFQVLSRSVSVGDLRIQKIESGSRRSSANENIRKRRKSIDMLKDTEASKLWLKALDGQTVKVSIRGDVYNCSQAGIDKPEQVLLWQCHASRGCRWILAIRFWLDSIHNDLFIKVIELLYTLL